MNDGDFGLPIQIHPAQPNQAFLCYFFLISRFFLLVIHCLSTIYQYHNLLVIVSLCFIHQMTRKQGKVGGKQTELRLRNASDIISSSFPVPLYWLFIDQL